MCGIAGIIHKKAGKDVNIGEQMTSMLQALKHRGPDSTGYAMYGEDNGNQIIDVHHLDLKIPYETEQLINNIPGVVENGIFSSRKADIILQSSDDGVEVIN